MIAGKYWLIIASHVKISDVCTWNGRFILLTEALRIRITADASDHRFPNLILECSAWSRISHLIQLRWFKRCAHLFGRLVCGKMKIRDIKRPIACQNIQFTEVGFWPLNRPPRLWGISRFDTRGILVQDGVYWGPKGFFHWIQLRWFLRCFRRSRLLDFFARPRSFKVEKRWGHVKGFGTWSSPTVSSTEQHSLTSEPENRFR